ncbi:MAG: hypothetical protein IJ365_00110 [Clostridia bacterium]|nr:hypothetical protein [Clostridia bacterium]
MGGTLDETAFNNYGFEANQMIITATHNRTARSLEVVKACTFKLITILNQSGEFLQKGHLSAAAHDDLSQSFDTPTSADYSKAAQDAINTYLMHEVDENGVPLLYAGVSAYD